MQFVLALEDDAMRGVIHRLHDDTRVIELALNQPTNQTLTPCCHRADVSTVSNKRTMSFTIKWWKGWNGYPDGVHLVVFATVIVDDGDVIVTNVTLLIGTGSVVGFGRHQRRHVEDHLVNNQSVSVRSRQ